MPRFEFGINLLEVVPSQHLHYDVTMISNFYFNTKSPKYVKLRGDKTPLNSG